MTNHLLQKMVFFFFFFCLLTFFFFSSSFFRVVDKVLLLMSLEQHNLVLARQSINRAKMEEKPTGDPLIAARNYLTAMECIQAAAASVANSSLQSSNERDFFLFQVKGKLAVYEERVKLLLGAAREMGLEDVPQAEGGMSSLFGGSSATTDIDQLLRNLEVSEDAFVGKSNNLVEA